MKILALDPGTERTAWVLFDETRVLDHAIEANDDLRSILSDRGEIAQYLAIEMIASYGMPVGREVFETCVWIGRFVESWYPLPFGYVYRRDVKLELCGSPRAKDANVRQALLDRIGPQGTKKAPGPTYGLKADEWAALGVAVTAMAHLARDSAKEPSNAPIAERSGAL